MKIKSGHLIIASLFSLILFIDLVHAGNFIRGAEYRWPNGIVPYEISSRLTSSQQKEIIKAIDHWNCKTRFVLRRKASGDVNWIIFVRDSESCSSPIGRQEDDRDGQKIHCDIGNGFNWGSVVHEIGHAVGLYHEQTRPDRDKFVKIKWDNIRKLITRYLRPGHYGISQPESRNFEKSSSAIAHGKYDFSSIMHYGKNAFRRWPDPDDYHKNGRGPTIRVKISNTVGTNFRGGLGGSIIRVNNTIRIGQRRGLSKGDKAVANFLAGRNVDDPTPRIVRDHRTTGVIEYRTSSASGYSKYKKKSTRKVRRPSTRKVRKYRTSSASGYSKYKKKSTRKVRRPGTRKVRKYRTTSASRYSRYKKTASRNVRDHRRR